jgi:hypothetical protein
MTLTHKPADEAGISILKDKIERREALAQLSGLLCVRHNDASGKKRVTLGEGQLSDCSVDKRDGFRGGLALQGKQ